MVSGLVGLVAALALLRWVNAPDTGGGPGSIGVYLPGNWPAPFGIVLVADRLSTMMVALTKWWPSQPRSIDLAPGPAGVHFHPLLQLQLMGLNGAFLTGDLFNLFVFFEVMLAASYGLLLHGSGLLRVRAGLHYIAINSAASSLFLIGAAMLYGVTGTLNFADLGARIAEIAPADRGLVHAVAAILATAFFAKAGAWPLNFWLVPAYSAVSPVSAVFALLTKLGVYTLLRTWTLFFGADTGASAQFGQVALLGLGMATLAVGAIDRGHAAPVQPRGLLRAGLGRHPDRRGGPGAVGRVAGALYYLLSSTLAASALFLLIDMIERWRNAGQSIAPHESAGNAPFLSEDLQSFDDVNLDDEAQALYGRAIPAGVAFLGLSFVGCTLLMAGLPPLSGFVGKFAMLSASPERTGRRPARLAVPGLLLASGFLTLGGTQPQRHPPFLDRQTQASVPAALRALMPVACCWPPAWRSPSAPGR